ncbi:MAG: Maf family protein [Thermoguttaceae bacterium]
MGPNRPRPKLILASRSPRRRQLLAEAGYEFEVIEPGESAEPALRPEEEPAGLAARLAYEKAADVAGRVEAGLIVACDTLVECGGQILGKPANAHDARRMLEVLRGREHRVFSGLCVWNKPAAAPKVGVEATLLRMDPLSDAQIEHYLATGAWEGKAGGFGYQDGLDWVHVVQGSQSNVVGLPMELLARMLAEIGMDP